MTFAFAICCICNVSKTRWTRREVMERQGDSLFVSANIPTWLHKLLDWILLSVLWQFIWHVRCRCGFTGRRDRYQHQRDTCQEYQWHFRFFTFLCALACSSTYFWTSLISSCSFLTNSMWQLASFSVELLKTSHTGAKVLGQTTTH